MTLQYSELEPGLGLSGKPSCGEDVGSSPFQAVLNVCDFHQPRYAEELPAGVQLVRRPINDIYPAPLPYLTLAVLELANLLQEGAPTLVHCHAGRSRSPSVIALYRMARDQTTWEEAIEWIRARRDVVEPNIFFRTDSRRIRIVQSVQQFLAGDAAVLAQARESREELIRTLQERPPDPALPDTDWNLIEGGFALGAMRAAGHLLESQIDHALAIDPGWGLDDFDVPKGVSKSTFELELSEDDAMIGIQTLLDQIKSRRASGQRVCLLSPGDELSGMFAACAYLMQTKGWDVASALWYIGSRRTTIWPHVDMLWSHDWSSI